MLESRIQLSFIPIKSVVIIEIFDARCTRSLGQSGSIRTAINILNALSAAGRLGTRLQAKLCTYRGASPQRKYTAACRGGQWKRLPQGGLGQLRQHPKYRTETVCRPKRLFEAIIRQNTCESKSIFLSC